MKSMTAYAYVHKKSQAQTLQVILRSLNFKYLDISVHNLSAENILLEEKIKKEVKGRLCRGKIEVYVSLKGVPTNQALINEAALGHYVAQMKKVARRHKLSSQFDISNFLNLPHVVFWKDKKIDERFVLLGLKEAISRLVRFKEEEGRAIKRQMLNNLRKLRANVKKIKRKKPSAAQTEGKEDIDEEVSLMSFYISKLENKVNSNNSLGVGKSIDFLTQEILRELNALSSKTKRKTVALLAVEAKTYLERVREQAQNVE